MIAWLRRCVKKRLGCLDAAPSVVDDQAHTAQRDELKKRAHDAAHRLHVLEWQADVASRKFKEGQE